MGDQFPKHREFVGRPDAFDTLGASHFTLLTMLGLREHHTLLDFGCGSLRSGRFLLAYLQPGKYFAVEPNSWLVEAGIEEEVGRGTVDLKKPTFRAESDFVLTRFEQSFQYIHAHSILTHAAPWMMEKLFEQIRQVMSPKGAFVGSLNIGAPEYQGRGWVYPGQVKYRPESVTEWALKNALRAYRVAWPHPSQTYLLLLHENQDLRDFLESVDREHLLPIAPLITPLV